MTLYELYAVIAIPILRGIAGWAQNALADGKVNALEWKKLLETVLKLGVPATALFYGFNFPVEMAVAFPIIADYIYSYIKKIKTVTPTVVGKKK